MRGFLSPCVGVILLRRFVGTLIGTKIHCFTLSIQCKRLDNGLNVVRNPSKYSLKRFRHSVWRNYAFAGDVIAQTRFMSDDDHKGNRRSAGAAPPADSSLERSGDFEAQKTKRRDNELQFVDFEGCRPRSVWFYVDVLWIPMMQLRIVNLGNQCYRDLFYSALQVWWSLFLL